MLVCFHAIGLYDPAWSDLESPDVAAIPRGSFAMYLLQARQHALFASYLCSRNLSRAGGDLGDTKLTAYDELVRIFVNKLQLRQQSLKKNLTVSSVANNDRYRHVMLLCFWWTFWAVTVFRIFIFVAHAASRQHVFRFLRSSGWRKIVGEAHAQKETVHLLHAFGTGFLCHILALAPLYAVLTWVDHSVALVPIRLAIDGFCLWRFWKADFNAWLYRDHVAV
eukprot:INCI14572.3.p1 GENE.INCI14572.3~~INCI14572.3.p1  ORF type:complete len:222 (-),score=33.81 INCI14572.3:1329-1994(-)